MKLPFVVVAGSEFGLFHTFEDNMNSNGSTNAHTMLLRTIYSNTNLSAIKLPQARFDSNLTFQHQLGKSDNNKLYNFKPRLNQSPSS